MSTHAKDSASLEDAPKEALKVKDSAAVQFDDNSKESENNTSPADGKENSTQSDGKTDTVDGNESMAFTNDAEPKKKKRSRKSKGQKKRATGFEEYFCDPPITPAEHEEEKTSIYPSTRPFVDRIEECIQRYRARRRLDNARELLFSRYLFLGGIDTTARQFQGTASLTKRDLDGMDKNYIRDISANDVVERKPVSQHGSRYYNPNQPEHWDVDFAGVTAGFLSETLVRLTAPGCPDYLAGVDLVSNFLKYVDLHDVCPEYAEDIKNAQKVCQKAREEMPPLVQIIILLPGDFGTAANRVTCNEGVVGHDNTDGELREWEDVVMDLKTARQKVGIVLSILMSSKCGHEKGVTFEEPTKQSGFPTVVKTITQQAYEVVGIIHPNEECHAKFKSINKHLGDAKAVKPCGFLQVKPTVLPSGWENAMHRKLAANKDKDVIYNLVMEEEILALMKVGFKFEMDICLMNCGFGFVKKSLDGHPTFYEFLPQELMWGYKEPVANPRPGPSIHNPTGAFEGGDGMGDFLHNQPDLEDDEPSASGGGAASGSGTAGDSAATGDASAETALVKAAPVDATQVKSTPVNTNSVLYSQGNAASVDNAPGSYAVGEDDVEWEL